MVLGYKWEGRLLAQVFVSVIFGIISIYILVKNWISFEVNKDYIMQLLKFGIPLIFYSIFYLLMFHINRFIVAKFLSLEELGILNVSIQLGAFIDLIASSFNIAFFPWIYRNLSNIDNLLKTNQNNLNSDNLSIALDIKRRIVKIVYLYVFSLFFISLIVYFVFIFIMKYFLGPSFHKAIEFLLVIIWAFYFKALYYIFSYFIVYTGKTIILTIITVIIAIFSIFLSYYFVMFFGIWGAVYSFFITFFIYFLITFLFTIKIYKLPWFTLKN